MPPSVRGGDGRQYPASAFLYVPDRSKPSTWKIRVKEYVGGNLKVTAKILGAAWAALGKGFRGQKAALPESVIATLKGRVRRLYKSIGAPIPEQMDPEKDIEGSEGETEVITESSLVDLFEGPLFPSDVKAVWDEKTGTFKNLAMLGPTSKNGRRYRAEVQRDAVERGVYEGKPCYIDHKEPDRKGGRRVRELAGRWKNVRFDEASGLIRGDLRTLKQHRNTLVDIYENGPELAAPSHVIDGLVQKVKVDGRVIEDVCKIVSGHSVDIVAGAATVRSLAEHHEPKPESKGEKAMFDIHEGNVTLDDIKRERPDLFEQTKDEGVDYKAKYLTEKQEREKLEAAAKLSESQKALKEALEKSKIPEKGRERILEMYKDTLLDEAGVKAAVEGALDFLEKCGLKETDDNPEPNPDLPKDEEGDKGKVNFAQKLKEGFMRKAGIEVKPIDEKEKEKK